MTTITTAKLREMAHTLGTTPDNLMQMLQRHLPTSIDDTPADTEEHDMATMTITQEQLRELINCHTVDMRDLLASWGITIAPAEPPAEMVKLAREICESLHYRPHCAEDVALAALQHTVDVAKKEPSWKDLPGYGSVICLDAFLSALGAA